MSTPNPFYSPVVGAAAMLLEGLHGRASVAQVRAAGAVLDRAFEEADRELEMRVARLEVAAGIGPADGSIGLRIARLTGAVEFAHSRKLDVWASHGSGAEPPERRSSSRRAKSKRRGPRAR